MATTKRLLVQALRVPGALTLLAPLLRGRATILMLHRFSRPDLGVKGHTPEALTRLLAYLRRHRFNIMPVTELLQRALAGEPIPDAAVAFTMDDGYEDQALVGLEAFAEYDCPATLFVTSGFLDGALWFWWDRVEYVFEATRRPALLLQGNAWVPEYRWTGHEERAGAKADFIRRCRALPDAEKEARIAALALAAEVEVPRSAPPRYAAMSWATLRSYEQRGMRFGPHSVTHPLLAQTPDALAEAEIAGSWRRLQEETRDPSPVFCYPYGQVGEFGPRDYAALERTGLLAALTGTPGYLDWGCTRPQQRWQIPRFAFADDHTDNLQYVAGFERLKEVVRRGGPLS